MNYENHMDLNVGARRKTVGTFIVKESNATYP